MPTDQNDIDRWSDALAGRALPGDPLPDHESRSLAALHAAIKTDDAASQSAGAADDIGRTRLLKRLEQEGLLESGSSNATRRSHAWRPWLGAAAAVFIVAVGLRIALPPDTTSQDPTTQVRGITGAIRMTAADPEVTAQLTETELRSLELEPRRLPHADRIVITVEVDADHLEAFHQWARPHGGRVLAPGTYRVLIDRAEAMTP